MDRATQYAEKVAIGDVPCGKLHKLACQRHLKDLEKQGTKDFPYIWKPEKSENILNFAEMLTIAEGSEPKSVKLFGSQCFDLGVPMGWVKPDGYRRFRRSYESLGRQNGKTFKNGIRGTYFAYATGYKYGKLFTAATKKRQARLAWEEMMKFIKSDKDLSELFKIQEYKSLITCLLTNCTIEALSKEGGLDDGFRAIYCSVDEIHQHKDNKIYKALYNGTRSLPETLVSMITTRGFDLNSFCYEMDSYAQKVLAGTATANDFFIDIYSIDKGDDFFNENVWVKANPVLLAPNNPNLEGNLETFRESAETAKDMGGSELADFVVKSLNYWYRNQDNEFVNAEAFAECACDLTLDDFQNCSCNVGLDFSSGGDLTTYSLEFRMENDSFYIYSHSYMPRGRFEEHIKTDTAPYDVWEKAGLITVTGSTSDFKNDYKFIISELTELKKEYNLKFENIAIDPHNADGILADLEAFGCPVHTINQSISNLNDTTCDIQILVKSHKFHYNRHNELLIWSFLNAVTVSNAVGEIKVDKEGNKRKKRIDPVDATVDAHYIVVKNKTDTKVDVNNEIEIFLKMMGGDKQ